MEASPRKVVFLSRRGVGRRRERRRADAGEAGLAAALNAGEADAIAVVSERYGRFLRSFLGQALPDPATAEDVFQQVLVEVWRRGPQYDPSRASLLTWMLTIARSRAIDERRRRRPEPVEPALGDDLATDPADEQLEGLLERWRVAELLTRIPAEEATVLRLRFYDDLSQTEIAAKTGVKLGTVKTRMVRALRRLRDLIAEEERP